MPGLRRISGDGRGGLWRTADNVGTTQGYLLHRSAAGTWSRYALPHLGEVSQVALIPGRTSGWAAGTGHAPAYGAATIWAHGSAG